WVGTRLGLDRLDPGSTQFVHYFFATLTTPDTIHGLDYDIAESKNGDLWFATSNGLDRLNVLQNTFTHYGYDENDPGGISSSEITKVYFDRDGTLWVGTFYGGLDRYDPAGNRFLHYRNDPDNEQSLSNNSILSVYQDQKGKIWVGTDGGGLNLLNEVDGSFTIYSEEDGLASNVVYGILEDTLGNLWLSTNNGLSRFNPETGEFKNYSESDGLQGNEFNMNAYAQDEAGTMYFGGINGLTSFDPLKITVNPYVPPVMLLSVTQNGKEITPELNTDGQEQIVLRWPQNSFEFEFAALSYVDPKKNKHSYKLEDFDQDWIDAGSWREGRYTNLPGGTYNLRIKGSNEDGVWNESSQPLVVKVIPAFWQTLWVQISAVLLVFGLVFTIYSLRNASVKANAR
ncbi:histidine kinase, partial [bacterium]|nr:histidine kinase [bacterium]